MWRWYGQIEVVWTYAKKGRIAYHEKSSKYERAGEKEQRGNRVEMVKQGMKILNLKNRDVMDRNKWKKHIATADPKDMGQTRRQ